MNDWNLVTMLFTCYVLLFVNNNKICANIKANGISQNVCINCTAYYPGCHIGKSGWRAFRWSSHDRKSVLKIEKEDDGYEDETLYNCVTEGYRLKNTLETFVCFWSPELGCQAVSMKEVVNKHHFDYAACTICNSYCDCKLARGSSLPLIYGMRILTIIISLTVILGIKFINIMERFLN